MTWWEAGEPETIGSRTSELLGSRWGRPAEIVAAAPGRVNLIGEHTDYNRGLCLPLALPHATYAAVAARDDDRVRLASAQADEDWTGRLNGCGPGGPSGWPAYVAGVLWGLTEEGWPVPGVDLVVDSTVPLGAGLSSSASVECAVAAALAGLLGRKPDDPEVAGAMVRAGIRAESEVAGAPTGGMDQTIAVHGRAGSALLLDFAEDARELVPLDLDADDLDLLVIDTRVSHALTDGGYAERRAQCEAAAEAMGHPDLRAATLEDVAGLADDTLRRRARHVVAENTRVLEVAQRLRAGAAAEIGPLLEASHASLRDDFEVSCAELDVVVEAAVGAGALGARMTGGGFGGSAVALLPRPLLETVREAVTDAASRRSQPEPRFLAARPGPGARVLG